MGKGEQTRALILSAAVDIASQHGLGGLTIGDLATRLGMSKSGLFAHFGSKEELQLAVIEEAARRFSDTVVRPALAAPRGLARCRALFDAWLQWSERQTWRGGCLLAAAAFEFDDQPGPVRDALAQQQRDWMIFMSKAVQMAVEQGELQPSTDTRLVAFELLGIVLAYYHGKRLLDDDLALDRARAAFGRMLGSYQVKAE